MLKIASIVGLMVLMFITRVSAANQCLTMRDEIIHKRTAHMWNQVVHINFEVSRRVTHRLSSQILRIFLTEVLGYRDVNVVEYDDKFNDEDTFARLNHATFVIMNDKPRTEHIEIQPLVNLETWIPTYNDPEPLQTLYTDVRDLGSIAPPGHFGWLVPEPLSRSGEFWTTFAKPETAARFDVDEGTLSLIRNNAVNSNTGGYYCNETYCHRGMYIPERCQNRQSCALLITSHPDVTSFVKDDIDQMKLYVRVIWVGPNLKYLTETLTTDYLQREQKSMTPPGSRSLVFLHWTPSSLVPNATNFATIAFPRCGTLASNISCHYEPNRLTKLVWGWLETVAKSAYEAIDSARFSAEMYEDLIDRYNRQSAILSEEDIACGWLRDNIDYATKEWIPSKHQMIYVGGIFPMRGTFDSGRSIHIAAAMAKRAINSNSTVLSNYNMSVIANDGQCKSDTVLKSFIDFMVNKNYQRMVGVLGPACSETVEPLIGVTKHYKTVVISYSAEGSTFDDRSKYPYFFRTIGENKQYKDVYLELFKMLKWKRVAALTEDGQKYTEYISYMEDILRTNDITFVSNFKFPREREAGMMTKYLQDLKDKKAKIIIADVNDQVARQVMCEASRLEMTAAQGYVWFLPLWLRPQWYDTDRYNKSGENVPCTTLEMSKAINGYLGISHAYFGQDDAIMQENITVLEWRNRYEAECKAQDHQPSNYAGYAYDAMWTYAYAMDQLLKEKEAYLFELHSQETIDRLTAIIGELDFNGVSGRIQFLGGPSRYSVIHVMQYINNETRLVGNFYPNISEEKQEIMGGRLDLNESAIVWLSNTKPPTDGSEPARRCIIAGFADFLNVSCEVAFAIMNILGIAVLAMIVVIGFIIIKRKYEKKVKYHEMYMKSLGLDLRIQGDGPDLDKWEIPRDRVLINRKLGEGAFGMVYGGEAFFHEKGWLAVAVKTLKVGSSTDEKLDFLSEVEVMKRFEHKNIIKLLGVCIKGEPVLTVMEFMLYGDLKTYLLARRHLVNDQSYEDSDEISSKKLTAMALDVARALSYLAQLKYVHRDVASRNCLVNAQRMVKLGDFGMTRPMYEHDYYKFNRKGMLPVRWMAPESLGLGVFTPASDVWSYGVLLYEIITFGSFPFQGMSNNEVLIHVKAGNSLVVPKGVKVQLESLIYSCWRGEHHKRPTAPEIVDFLATNPRIISPCLDVPIASVQLELAGQLDMQLTENNRKFSLSWPSREDSRPSISASSPMEIPNPPLLDITCQEDKNQECLLGDVVCDVESSKPLLANSHQSGPVICLQNFKRNENESPRYVNVHPGMALDRATTSHSVGTIPNGERKNKLTENGKSEDVSIL